MLQIPIDQISPYINYILNFQKSRKTDDIFIKHCSTTMWNRIFITRSALWKRYMVIRTQRFINLIAFFIPKQFNRWTPSSLSWYMAYLHKVFPLDMSQYGRLFNSTRVPAPVKDELRTNKSGRHVLVIRNGNIFTFDAIREDGMVFFYLCFPFFFASIYKLYKKGTVRELIGNRLRSFPFIIIHCLPISFKNVQNNSNHSITRVLSVQKKSAVCWLDTSPYRFVFNKVLVNTQNYFSDLIKER